MYILTRGTLLALLLTTTTHARCYDPSPAFPIPKFLSYDQSSEVVHNITTSLRNLVARPEYHRSSFSIEVTTSENTLRRWHHTAEEQNQTRPGTKDVNGDSVFRMASVTKAFTTLAIIQQHIAGNLSLDDPINQYLDLQGDIPWKDITLRTAASQLSGIPREFAQSDLLNSGGDPTALGLPPASKKDLPQCDEYHGFDRPCDKEDLLADLAKRQPLWPPKQKSTYSNVNFVLLGLVVENVTGLDYSDYVEQAILRPLNMGNSSFVKPDDTKAVLIKGDNYWDAEEGILRPTGGLYSSSSDISKFVRYVLGHYNGLTPQLNWLQPSSYSTTLSSFFGTPWEIFRTTSILPSTSRPNTFVTKAGGVPGYFSNIIMVPEYDLGFSILTASPDATLLENIRDIVTVPLVQAAENFAQADLGARYTGVFAAQNLNSTLILAHSASQSLYVESFISNGTDVLNAWQPLFDLVTQGRPSRIQLVPTLLYREEKQKKGELWRGIAVPEKRGEGIWDDFCITDDDPVQYAGKPLFEVVFWGPEDGKSSVREVELSAFRVKLERVEEGMGSGSEMGGWAKGGLQNLKQSILGN